MRTWTPLALAAFLTVLFPVPSSSQCVDYAQALHSAALFDAEGSVQCVAVSGDRAYLVTSTHLVVAGLSDPLHPSVLGRLDIGATVSGSIAVDGDLAYVAAGGLGLLIVDVAQPESPALLATLPLPGTARYVDVAGPRVTVLTMQGELHVVDAANPAAPAPAGSLPLFTAGSAVILAGDRCFASGSDGVAVVDLAIPSAPNVVATLLAGRDVDGIAREGDMLYACYYDIPARRSFIEQYDIADPLAPVFLASLTTTNALRMVATSGRLYTAAGSFEIFSAAPGSIEHVGGVPYLSSSLPAIRGNFAYLPAFTGLRVIDMTVPTVPAVLAGEEMAEAAREIVLAGDRAFVNDNPDVTGPPSAISVVDISNPLAPSLAGSIPAIDARAIAISGNMLATNPLDGTLLQTWDIEDPAAPRLLGSEPTSGPSHGLAAQGDYVYAAAGTNGIEVFDVRPRTLSGLPVSGPVQDIDMNQSRLYVAGGAGGLSILNTSAPADPAPLGTFPGLDAIGVHAFGFTQSLVGVLDAGGAAAGRWNLLLYDLSDVEYPEVYSNTTIIGGVCLDVRITGPLGQTALVARGSGGVRAYDISDPYSPVAAGSFDTPGVARAIEVDASLAFVVDGADAFGFNGGLRILDTSNPNALVLVGETALPGDPRQAVPFGSRTYVACGSAGLQIVDTQNPASPVVLGAEATPTNASCLAVSYPNAYVGSGPAVHVVDVTDPANPLWIRSIPVPDDVVGLEYRGSVDLLYAATADSGLFTIDVVPPAPVGSVPTRGDARRIALWSDLAFVAEGDSGLSVLDLSDPAVPVLVGGLVFPGPARDVATDGVHVFVADQAGALHVVDVGDPEDPVLLSSETAISPPTRLAAADGIVYLGCGRQGIQVVDARDPVNPATLTVVRPGLSPWNVPNGEEPSVRAVTTRGELVFVGADQIGAGVADFLVLSAQCPGGSVGIPGGDRRAFSPQRLRAFPNPIARSGTVAFRLEAPGQVDLHVLDPGGRRIRVLANRRDMPAGLHQLSWDGRDDAGRDLPSGVYFYRLQAPGWHEVRRFVKLR